MVVGLDICTEDCGPRQAAWLVSFGFNSAAAVHSSVRVVEGCAPVWALRTGEIRGRGYVEAGGRKRVCGRPEEGRGDKDAETESQEAGAAAALGKSGSRGLEKQRNVA